MMKYIILFFGLVAICHSSSPSGRIIGGLPSGSDDLYAVTVFSSETNETFPIISRLSTGVAISEHVIVVSGQAIHGFVQWRVGVDSNNRALQSASDVDLATFHPNYDPATLEFNVGVLRINTAINHYITLAAFAPSFPVLFGIGFGHNTVDETLLPNISQQTAVFVTTFDECRREFNSRVIRPTNFCIEAVQQFANGDQGAPLVDFARQQVYGSISFWNYLGPNPVVAIDFTNPEIQSFLRSYL